MKQAIINWVVVFLAIGGLLLAFSLTPSPTSTSTSVVSLENSIQNTINNVVHIRNKTCGWQGSGVLVAPDLILTARHVAEAGEDFDIMTNDGKVYKATRAISSKKYDLGFIKLDVKLSCTTIIGSIEGLKLGQSLYAIGSPYGDMNFNSVTVGVISSLKRELEKFGCAKHFGWSITFQTDTNGEPGNSGCPVFTLDNKVVGILVGGWSNGVIYCIPVELIVNDIELVQRMFDEDRYEKESSEQKELTEGLYQCH